MGAAAEVYEYQCTGCEALFNSDDVESPTYECSRCGTEFTRDDSADGDSNRCASCNVFAAKVSDVSCPECGGSGVNVEEGEFRPPSEPTPEERAAQEAADAEARERSRALHERVLAEEDAKRAAMRVRWAADGDDLAQAFVRVRPGLADEVRDYYTAAWASPGSHFMLRAEDAAGVAQVLLGLPREPWDSHGDYELREARGAALAPAFADLDAHGYAQRWGWSSQATGLAEPVMAELARRLRALGAA